MKRFLQLFIFLFVIFITPKVFAAEYNITNKIKALTNYTTGSYYGVTPAVVPVPNYYNVNTRYSGTLSQIEFYLNSNDWDWQYNKTYTITLTMATDDWRNKFMGPQVFRAESNGSTTGSNMYVSGSFKFVSMRQIKFNFKVPSTMSPYIKFTLYSSNTTNTAITGVSNWNLSSVKISTTTSATPVPAVTPTPTPTPQPNNQDIINNANANTNSIINNNTQNTQDIIDNQTSNSADIIDNANANTDKQIDNANNNAVAQEYNDKMNENTNTINNYNNTHSCQSNLVPNMASYHAISTNIWRHVSSSTDYIRLASYDVATGGNFPIGYSFPVSIGKEYFISFDTTNNTYARYQVYMYKSGWSSGLYKYFDVYQNAIIIKPDFNGTIYLQFYMLKDNKNDADFYIRNLNVRQCVSKDDELKDAITSDDVESGVGGGFFDDFTDNQHGLTGIITAPLNAIQRLTSSTCQPLSVPIPFTNSNVSLPCMTQVYETNIPTVYNIWKIVSFGIIGYFICIDIFHIVKGFKDPESDKVEVLDL